MVPPRTGVAARAEGFRVRYEIIDGELILSEASRAIARGRRKRKSVEECTTRRGRLAHLFYGKVDVTRERWW
jgi:hypothetical protein